MDTQSQHGGINFGSRLHMSPVNRFSRTHGGHKYEPTPLRKLVLNEVRKAKMAYKLPEKGNWNHDENRRRYDNKTKVKIVDEMWNCNVRYQQNKVKLHVPSLYPSKSSIRPSFTQLTDKNTAPIAKGALESNHELVPIVEDTTKQPTTSMRPNPLKGKEGFLASSVGKPNPQIRPKSMHGSVAKERFLASSVERLNPQVICPKPMCGILVRGVQNGGTFKQYGVSLKGQSTIAKDNTGKDLTSCKGKNDYISKVSNLSETRELLVPNNKGNSYEDNKRDKICNYEVMIGDDKKILDHVNLGSIKSLKRDYIPSTFGDHYKDVMKGNEDPSPSPLTKDEPKKHDKDECEDCKSPRPTKKRRRYIVNVDEEDDYNDQNPMDLKDSTKITMPIAAESIKRQFYNCIQPIDEPIWSGIFKVGGNEYIAFSAHLSTKSCKKVWDLSVSIPSIVQVTKLSRSEVWPKSLESSSPTDDSIGLYFFPPKMRLDKGMDQLVKEIVEKDMALSAVIGEAQMLVFPSTLLPEKFQTFQGKHYLWGAFKRRGEDNQQAAAMAAERVKQEQENTELQNASKKQHDEAQRKEPSNNLRETPVIISRLEKKPSAAVTVTHSTAASASERKNERRPAEAGNSVPANHGSSRVIGLVVRQTPGVEELIQQMRRGGALLATIEGEMMGGFEANDNAAKKFRVE